MEWWQEVLEKAEVFESHSKKEENYKEPPIPDTYKHVSGGWNDGFVIESIKGIGQFVWVPVGSLRANGTLDGTTFNEKFGRRKYSRFDHFGKEWGYTEPTSSWEYISQCKSIEKYGGFYISRYNIMLRSNYQWLPRSRKECMPCVNVRQDEAYKIASRLENGPHLKSHLVFGAEYDSVLEWFIESGAKDSYEIMHNSTDWGNYFKEGYWTDAFGGWYNNPTDIVETGSREKWCVNGIYDLAGNVSEWTQELYHERNLFFAVSRGGCCNDQFGYGKPVSIRLVTHPSYGSSHIGFRAALWIE